VKKCGEPSDDKAAEIPPPEWGWMSMDSKRVALIAVWASLYAALVVVFQPISFAAVQFRVADILPPSIAAAWWLSLAYGIGCAAANFFSPYVGAWELIFMPIMSSIAGILGYVAARFAGRFRYYVCGIVHAIIISLAVAYMLSFFEVPFLLTFPSVLVSELILGLIGASIFTAIERRWKWWE